MTVNLSSLRGADLKYLLTVVQEGPLHVGGYLKAGPRKLIEMDLLVAEPKPETGGVVLRATDAGVEAVEAYAAEQAGKHAVGQALVSGLGRVGPAQQQQTMNEVADFLRSEGVRDDLVDRVRNWLL